MHSGAKKKAHSNLHNTGISQQRDRSVRGGRRPARREQSRGGDDRHCRSRKKTVGAAVIVVAEAVTTGAACAYVTTGAGSTYSTTGNVCPYSTTAGRTSKTGAVDHLGGDRHCCSWENYWCRCHIGHNKGAGISYSTTGAP